MLAAITVSQQRELRVFHNSYPCSPPVNVKSMLSVVKENNAHVPFRNLFSLLKIYGTIPVSTATVERSFSKLNLVKSRLLSLCGEERLSDLQLLSIEKDVPIVNSKVIEIFRDMANRRLYL